MSEFDNAGSLPAGGDSGAGSPSPSGPGFSGSTPGGAPSEQTFDVTINGKVEKVALSELQKGYSRHQDYTQKTQRLAGERQAIQQQVQEYEGALREVQSFLQDKNRVAQYLHAMGDHQGAAAAQAGVDPMQLMTRQEAEQMLQMRLQQIAPQIQQPSQEIANLRLEMATREYKGIFDSKIAELQQTRPELARLGARGAAMIRMEALNQRPQSVEDAIQALEFAADAVASDLGNAFKQGVVATPAALRGGIESPGGQGVMPTPSSPFKKVTDPGLRAQVIQDLMSGQSGRSENR